MSTHGMLPDSGSSSASSAPLMPAFNPGESVFAVDTSKLNQALSWIIHSTKKHSADIDEVKRETAGLLARQSAAPPSKPTPSPDEIRQEFESRLQSIQNDHTKLNEDLQQQLQDLDALKQAVNSLSTVSMPAAADKQSSNVPAAADKQSSTLPHTPKGQDFVRMIEFSDVINELRSDLRKHSRFMVKVSERTGLQAAASQFERMVIRSKLKQFESKASASPDAANGRSADGHNDEMTAYLRGITRSSKRGKTISRDRDSCATASQPATPGPGVDLDEVQELVGAAVPGELPLHSDADEEIIANDSRYLVAFSNGLNPDQVAASAQAGSLLLHPSGDDSRDRSTSRGGSHHGKFSQVLSIQDDAESQTEITDASSRAAGVGHFFDFGVYEERLNGVQSNLETLQQMAGEAMSRVAHVENGLISMQDHLRCIEARHQMHSRSRPNSAASHDFGAQTDSPRSQHSDAAIAYQASDVIVPAENDVAAPNATSAASLQVDVDAPVPFSPVAAVPKVSVNAMSEVPSSPVAAPSVSASPASASASSLQNRRGSLNVNLHARDMDKTRDMFLDRPEERALKEKRKAEELAQRVPLEDFLAVKAEAEATKKALSSAETLLKQLAVRVSALEETCAPKAAITVLEGNTSKRIVGLEGRLRTLSSILSAKADTMTVDAVSASVEANASGLTQLKDRLENLLQSDGDDKSANDHMVLLSSLHRMKNDITVMESRLASELKDIKASVDLSNSSVRILQSTFASEKLRQLNHQKSLQHSQTTASSNSEAASSKRNQPLTSTQGMMSESGHIINNAVPGSLSSSPSAARPKPREVEGSVSAGYKGGSLSIPENAALLKANMSWPNEMTQEQEIAAAHAAAAIAPKTVASVTGESVSDVLLDPLLPKATSPSLFNIINGAKHAPFKQPPVAPKVHQPQLPPDYELSGLPPPTRQKLTQAPIPLPPSPVLPHLAEGRQSLVSDRKNSHVKF